MFNQHYDLIISKYNLDQLCVQGTVTLMEPSPNYVNAVIIRTPNHDFCDGTKQNMRKHSYLYMDQNVILALGNDVSTYVDWVTDKDINKGFVHCLFDLNPTHSTNYN